MQEVSRPIASAGVLGTTTFKPGMCASQLSRVWEWVAPEPMPPNTAVRTVSGMARRPPDMNRDLAAWLTSWSSAMLTKSMIMTSATGRSPAAAAPTAAPTIAASEMGVSRTRSAPWVVERPLVIWEIPPPGSAMSSPMSTTPGSVARARSSTRLSASRMLIVVTLPPASSTPAAPAASAARLARAASFDSP